MAPTCPKASLNDVINQSDKRPFSGYLWSLWLRKTFGVSEYRHMIYQENLKVCRYEDNERPIILGEQKYCMSARHRKMMRKKGHLVLRILENRLTSILLLQAINKLLTQARTKDRDFS